MILRLVDILNFNLNFNLWCTKGISVHKTGVSYFETLHLLYAFILIWIWSSQLLSNEERLLRRMHAWYQYSLFCDSNGESNKSLDQILLWQRTNAWNVSIYICLSGQLVCILLTLLVIQILLHQLNGLTCGRLQSIIFRFVSETC